MISLVVPGDVVGALSPNLRLHYYERHRRNQDWRQRAWLAWQAAGRPQVTGKVRLTFTIRRSRRVDPDNALASMKALVDGLVDQPGRPALLRDDNEALVEFGAVRFECGAAWSKRPEVIVAVELLGDEEQLGAAVSVRPALEAAVSVRVEV